MNDALVRAMLSKGIDSKEDRRRFALTLGVSEVTLRRWMKNETQTPHRSFQKKAAQKLGVRRQDLWP